MLRAAPGIVLVAVVLVLPAQGNFDCGKAFENLQEQLNRRTMSRERLADLRRRALRAYHACQTGDIEVPKALFDRLDRENY